MKIALNCCYYGETSGGIKEYIYNLVTNLLQLDSDNEYVFYVSIDDLSFWIRTMPKEARYKIFPFRRDQKVKRALLQHNFWQDEYRTEKFDIFHSPFFHLPNIEGCKSIMTVHDLRFRRYPESYTFARRTFIGYAFKKSLNRVSRIITVSEFTKREILSFYDYPDGKIVPIHESVDNDRYCDIENDAEILSRLNLEPRSYLLTVGHIEPRKNYPMLIDAVETLNNSSELNIPLIIVGKKNYKYQATLRAISRAKHTIYLNYVEHETLLALYKNASLFVFPSIYEGFGFPPLEAARFGLPTVASNVSSIPEICGDGAYYFNPHSKDEIIDAIKRGFADRDMLQQKAVENLTRFSWKETANKTIDLYRELKNDN